jgi:hypothetical protein
MLTTVQLPLRVLLFIIVVNSAAVSQTTTDAASATYINFATTDILNGDDGLTPHPLLPDYGKPTYPITTDGNGREQVEAHLTYFEGKYWMHAATWGCGGSLFVYSAAPPSIYVQQSPVYPPGDYGEDGNCGIKSYSSPDMTNWTLEDFYQPTSVNVTKPVVRYSNATGQYVMFMGGNAFNNFFYATSISPGGPWSNPPSVMTGRNINHDFDIAVGPDGTHYILSDIVPEGSTIQNLTSRGNPVWDIYVQQLGPNLTATAGNNATGTLIRTAAQLRKQGLTLEACGFFYHDNYYYMTFGFTCQNCNGYVYYYYSQNPLGPYTDGGMLTMDGCGAQNKGTNVLPSSQGPIVLAGALGYRTSPGNLVVNGQINHADNQQAASSTYFFPLEFNSDHTIKHWTCPATVQIPLVANITKSPAGPTPYQLDCRIRNWQTTIQTFDPPKNASTIEFPVWQRTDNLSPQANAGPMLNGILNVTLGMTDGSTTSYQWPASNISWAPSKISMSAKGKQVTSVTLTTNATNGCYGTLTEPKIDQWSSYGVRVKGMVKDSPLAQMYVYQY